MEMSFKQELYFVINIDDPADRAVITRAVREVLEPEFEKLIKKIRLDNKDKKKFEKLTGMKADIALISKKDYINRIV